MYGLTTSNGDTPIRKPWRVDANVDFGTHLGRKCDGTHDHVHCCGKHARESSHYTEELVMCIHEAWGNYTKTHFPDVECVSETHLKSLASDFLPQHIPKHRRVLNHASVAFARAGPYIGYAMCAPAQSSLDSLDSVCSPSNDPCTLMQPNIRSSAGAMDYVPPFKDQLGRIHEYPSWLFMSPDDPQAQKGGTCRPDKLPVMTILGLSLIHI